MRQDLLKGKPTEIDHMNGAVVALGQRFGIDCPVNGALVAIIRAMDRSALRTRVCRRVCGWIDSCNLSRVGIVAKSHLRAATPHLVDIDVWLASARHRRRCSRPPPPR